VIYRLERESYSEYEIVVYGKAKKKEVAKRTLNLQEIRKVPGFGGDAVKVIQALPGVARPFFGGGEIIVRGAGSEDNQYYLEGMTIPYIYHFGGLKSNYNSEALQSVEFFPGGFGTRYGNALGGVVEIKGRPYKKDRWHGFADVNAFDASFMFESPITDNTGIIVTARRSYIADVLSFVVQDVLKQQLPFTVVPFYWDYTLRLDIEPWKKHHFFLTAFGAKDKLELISTDVRGGSLEIDDETDRISTNLYFHMGILGWDYDITEQLTNELRYSFLYLVQELSAFGFVKAEAVGKGHHIRDALTWELNPQFTLKGGLDILYGPLTHKMSSVVNTGDITKDTTDYIFGPYGAYLSLEWKPKENILVIPGYRIDYYPEIDYKGSVFPEFRDYDIDDEGGFDNETRYPVEPSLRISARYEFIENHTAKGSFGNYSQTPKPLGQATHPTWGNPELESTKGRQFVLGYEWQITDLISADIQGYLNRQWNIARFPDEKEFFQNPDLPPFIDNGKGKMMGFELFFKHDQGKRFFGWLTYSLSRSERYSYRDGKWALYERDIPNNAQLIASYRLPYNMEIGTRLRYTDGYPTTPIYGPKLYDLTYFYYEAQSGKENSDRMEPYVGFDLRFEKKFVFNNWMLTLYQETLNIVHLLRFAKNPDGDPVFEPPETDFYIWDYNYRHKNALSDVPRTSVGILAEF
ncbi:MAG: TonB-dependent receptor plug domain-containing protein, partial [Chitinivibrionales bacterium]|nr:TonB-dependent receptor plug domain-containing protein [Chitinivibrionales bacterium]